MNFKMVLIFVLGLTTAQLALASSRVISCNKYETCPVISTDFKETQKECNLSLQNAVEVHQQQLDNHYVKIGYTCDANIN